MCYISYKASKLCKKVSEKLEVLLKRRGTSEKHRRMGIQETPKTQRTANLIGFLTKEFNENNNFLQKGFKKCILNT